MEDKALSGIQAVSEQTLNFKWFRNTFASDNGLKDTLDFGHAVLDSTDKLDQYLYTHGLMIESQWKCAAPILDDMDRPVACIDYGSGQGLAGLIVNDVTGGRLLSKVKDLILIEPSPLALARSKAIYRRISPNSTITPICKRFDDISKDEIPAMKSGKTLHIFSNSLDILGFDPVNLLRKTLRAGHHTIVSVSHDRAFNGGTPQIARIEAALQNEAVMPNLAVSLSTQERFTCDNPGQSKGLVWVCEFEVRDG